MKTKTAVIALLLVFCCVALTVNTGTVYATNDKATENSTNNTANNSDDYFYYYEKNSGQTHPDEIITLNFENYNGAAGSKDADGIRGVVLYEEKDCATASFSVNQSGVYYLYLTYFPMLCTSKDIQVSIEIDGKLPYTQALEMSLPRIWADAQEGKDGSFAKDYNGNDLRPEQTEVFCWNTIPLKDVLGMYSEPYLFFLDKGEHTVKISCTCEAFILNQLVFKNEEKPIDYKEYLSQYKEKNAVGKVIRQEAEKTYRKNTANLYPSYDRSNAATLPNDSYVIKLNTIGGSKWNSSGASISWIVDVPKPGLYRLSFRVRQNFSDGLNAYRRLYINGKIPFAQAEKIVFPYNQGWYLKTLGDDEPSLLYLKPGDILTLECTSGSLDYPLREVQQAVLDLNRIYRDIIMITGTSPSLYQDYNLDKQIPELSSDLNVVLDRLKIVKAAMKEELKKSSSAIATIEKAVSVFEELAKDTYYIADRLSNFKSNIESLASLLLSLGGQGIELDCLYYTPDGVKQPSVKAGFFDNLLFNTKRFLATFTNDYNSIGGNADGNSAKPVLVWAGVGRDQAQIINRLIEEDFTEKTGIPVTLNLVTGDATLIKATLAGKGPEIALTVAQTTPVNLAARGALVNLTQFDLSRLKSEIYESAWTPFQYNGGIYAVPETMAADLLFYRTDIFESLGLKAPETWEEFYQVLEVVQSNNLEIGWPEINAADQGSSLAISIFDKFLFQSGGTYYNTDLTATAFDSETANLAFERTVELYRVYGMKRDLSFFNRFRSGEAPVGISSYSLFTQLVSSAPEIRGLWSIKQIPGTVKNDGTSDHTESAVVTGCVMMKSAVKKANQKEAFQFINWWSSAETQVRYGKEMEGVLGIIGRILPANRMALANLSWSKNELEIIDRQLQQTKNPPQVLGNYTVVRSLTSALRGAISDKNSPRRSLALYNKDINDEITRKRAEFNLN